MKDRTRDSVSTKVERSEYAAHSEQVPSTASNALAFARFPYTGLAAVQDDNLREP